MPEQLCGERLATHFWVCRVGKGTFLKLTLCPWQTLMIQFVYKDVAVTDSKNALERDELAFIDNSWLKRFRDLKAKAQVKPVLI